MLYKRKLLAIMFVPFLIGCVPNNSEITSLSMSEAESLAEHVSEEPTSSEPSIISDSSEEVTPAIEPLLLPASAALYPHATLVADGINVPLLNVLVNDSHVFANPQSTRIDSGYGRLIFNRPFDVVIKTAYALTPLTRIYPSAHRLVATHDLATNELYFTIYEPGTYVIITNDNEEEAIHLRVFSRAASEDLEPTITFTAGMHNQTNSPYIDSNNYVTLADNDVVYIAPDAIVNARFIGRNVENVTIFGHGIISGQTFDRRNRLVPINFEHSTNIKILDISIIDPAAWTLNLYFVNNAYIDDVSIISSRANGDGITLQSCTNIVVTNAFVRAYDDTLVVKNYASPYGNSNRATHGSSRNIIFDNCFLWVDLAQAMEIGYETVGAEMENIIFQNITVFYALHKPVISIHNANYADVHDIIFRNITVENLFTGQGDAGGNYELIDFKAVYSSTFSNAPAGGPTEVGNIRDVLVENVLVKRKERSMKITLAGQIDKRIDFLNIISRVSHITLKHITVETTNIKANYAHLSVNEYVDNVEVISGSATGHTNYATTITASYWE